MSGQVVRRGEDAYADVLEAMGDKVRVAGLAEADGHVEALIHEVDDPIRPAQL
nr:hypothetical protein [Zoogloea sp.]